MKCDIFFIFYDENNYLLYFYVYNSGDKELTLLNDIKIQTYDVDEFGDIRYNIHFDRFISLEQFDENNNRILGVLDLTTFELYKINNLHFLYSISYDGLCAYIDKDDINVIKVIWLKTNELVRVFDRNIYSNLTFYKNDIELC